MLKSLDRIKELTSTTGTGTLTLTGAESGFQAFSVLGNGTKCYYTITDVNTTDFEVGEGTYNSNTLTRDTIFESSNSGNAISLSASGSTVFVTYPADKSSYRDIGVNRDYTASGSITAGKPLILNADNTVSQVAETSTTIPAGLGTKTTTALASSVYDQQVAMGINGQFVSVYRQGNDYMCQVNTVSTDDLKTITHGTSQLTFNLSSSTDVAILYQPDADKYVLFYKDSSSYLTGSVMTVSGTGASATLTTATAVTLRSDAMSGSPNNSNYAYDTTNDVIVGAWVESGTIKSVSMPISGTTISANGVNSVPAYSGSISANQCRVAYSSTDNKIIYSYSDGGTEDLYTTVGSVNGTGLDFGSATIVSNLPSGNFNGNDMCVGVDNNGVVVLSYTAQDVTPAYILYSQAGTLSGTTITWGSPSQVSNVTCLSNAGNECSIASIASGKMIIARGTRSDSPSNADKGIFVIVTSSGTTVSNGSVQIFSSTASRYPCLAVNYSKTQAVINYGDSSSMDMNNIAYIESPQSSGASTNLTSDNYFGVASSTASTTEPVGVNRAGSFNNDQSGMTAGKDMYVSSSGLILERTTTTVTPDASPTLATALDTSFYSQNNGTSAGSMAYESTSSTYVVFASNQGNNQYPTIMAGTLSNGTMTYGTPTIVNSANSGSGFSNYICAGNGKIYVSFHSYESSNWYVWCKWYTISGTTFTGNSAGNVSLVTASTTRQISTVSVYDINADRVIFGYAVNDSTNKDLYYRTAEVTSTGFTLGTVLSIGTSKNSDNTDTSVGLNYDANAQRCVLVRFDGSTTYPIACVLQVGSSTITKGADVTLISDSAKLSRGIPSAYDNVNNKITFLWSSDTSPNYYPYYSIITVNAGANTLTATTPAVFFTGTQSESFNIVYDTSTSRFLICATKNAPSYDNDTYILTFTSNGSSLSLTDSTLASSSRIETAIAGATSSNGTAFYGKLDNGSNNNATITAYFSSTSSTVVNGSQFVGTARSGTDLELSEPPTELVAMANGSITKGKPVILRTDGDFAQVGGVSSSGSTVSPETQQISGQQNSEDKFFIADNGNGIFAVVSIASNRARIILGEDTGTSITWGSEVTLDNTSENITGVSVYYDSEEDKFIVTNVSGGSQNVCSYIVSYSGTTATKGTQSSLLALGFPNSNYVLASDYNTTDKKGIVCIGKDTGKLFTVTVSGTTITQSALSSQFSGSSNSAQFFQMVYDNTNSVGYITYRNEAISDYPYIQTFTVSGDTFSFGTETVIQSLAADGYVGVAEGSAHGKGVCVAWRSSGTGINYIAPTFSGLVPTIGGVTTLSGGQVPDTSLYWEGAQVVNYNPVSQSFIFAYQDTSGKYDIITNNGTVSGGTLTFSDYDVVYPTTNASQYYAISNPTGKNANNVFIIQQRYNQSPYKTAGSIWGASYNTTTTNLTSTNFIGFAENTVADNEDVKVKVISQTDENQTGLTTASQYYVQTDGTLSTTAGTPSVLGGTALSSTKILIKS